MTKFARFSKQRQIKEYNKSNNYLDWTGINEKTGKSKFIERILEGGNP